VTGVGPEAVLPPVPAAVPAEVADLLRAAAAEAFRATDPAVLGRCHARVVALLGGPDDSDRPARSPAEAACLAFTDEFVIDVATLADETAAAVRDHLGDAGLADFTRALLVVEQRERLARALQAVGV